MRNSVMVLPLLLLLISCHAMASQPISFSVAEHTASRILLPVIKNHIPVKADVTLSHQGKPVSATFYSRLAWPKTGEVEYVRLLVIEPAQPLDAGQYTITWQSADAAIRPFWGTLTNTERAGVTMPWLQQVVLLNTLIVDEADWYRDAMTLHARYIADDLEMEKDNYPITKASHWLYDKPQSFFQMYLLNNDRWALRQAVRYANFYVANITEEGFFGLTSRPDVKYIMSRGLTYYFLLYGDDDIRDAVTRQYHASLEWDPDYDVGRGFWTERNQAAVLNTAIAYWELTGSDDAKARIDAIIDATYKMTFRPVNDWPFRSCPQHTLQSHEGKGGDVAVCSPWMMALLADALWRVTLLTDSPKAEQLLQTFAEFIKEYGLYEGTRRNGEVVTAPHYLRAFAENSVTEQNVWTDPQHICEVASMVGKGMLAGSEPVQQKDRLGDTFSLLATLCRDGLSLVKIKADSARKSAVRLKPPRRFGWVYSTTAELPWMMERIL
ncbi:hypothetical protein [Alteromonas sp. CYL-A6]|uniref:hypothetical protein n=1 Tax=Alteromonas nitratireducens TaxID=3390813 RepID=UPI0034A71F28